MSKALDKLKEKQAELAKQIKEAEKEVKRKEAETYKEKSLIVGMALLDEMENGTTPNPELADKIMSIMNNKVTKAKDRKMLGLPPKNK